MDGTDNSKPVLGELPRLRRGDALSFRCGPGIRCFNDCCRDLDLVLSPYDVLGLRCALRLTSGDFFREHAAIAAMPGSGFPEVTLKMTDRSGRPCPFVAEAGCTVYADRPGACRVYPLGRGAGIGAQGEVVEQYVLVKEPHCRGLEEANPCTIEAYLEAQGMPEYIAFDDRYMKLIHRWCAGGAPLTREQFGGVFTAVYRPDRFPDFSGQPHLLGAVERAVEERALAAGFEWLTRQLFS